MQRTILFEHIPKTGGITLRGILQKVYGKRHVFFINSNHPRQSLDAFIKMNPQERGHIRVIGGHGVLLYRKYLENPFIVTILRDPVSLFFSQFHYLRISKKDIFWEDVRNMNTAGEYLKYALSMGQDNLMTRFLANSMQWTVDPDQKFQNMNDSGEKLLQDATQNLRSFDAVIDLGNFDAGVFALSRKLGWGRIPLYKPSNRTPGKPAEENADSGLIEKLRFYLRFDLELYEFFLSNNLDISLTADFKNPGFRFFRLRQQIAKKAAIALGKN